jgi:hypothetical protein
MNYSAQIPLQKILCDSREEDFKGIFERILRNQNSEGFQD